MNHHLNIERTVAVSDTQYWQPMTTCPLSVKVLLLGKGGVATIGQYHPDKFWVGWSPLPQVRKT